MNQKPRYIICPQCQTKYKRPEEIPPQGVNVKCRNCGNIFTVFSDDRRESPGRRQSDLYNDWLLKKANGDVLRVKDFAEIQQKIALFEIREDDFISRTGTDWRQLSAIENFRPFFDLVRRAKANAAAIPGAMKLSDEAEVVIDEVLPTSHNPVYDNIRTTPAKPMVEPESEPVPTDLMHPQIDREPIEKEERETEPAANDKDEFDSLFTEDDNHLLYSHDSNLKKIIIALTIFTLFAAASIGVYTVFIRKPAIDNAIEQNNENSDVKEPSENIEKKIPQEKKEAAAEVTDSTPEEIADEEEEIRKEPEEKEKPAPEAKEEAPAKGSASFTKSGWAYLDNGDIENAIKSFDAAIAQNPSMPDPYLGLGDCYNEQGNIQKAKEYYKKYLDMEPDETKREEVLKILNNL